MRLRNTLIALLIRRFFLCLSGYCASGRGILSLKLLEGVVDSYSISKHIHAVYFLANPDMATNACSGWRAKES